ncbi:MAG: tRNA (adenosine(37)-N6)-threonylcarbamoyltransferase complex ATPase subunit type 1 TsaE [Candidatus Methylomirabilales bacterium]
MNHGADSDPGRFSFESDSPGATIAAAEALGRLLAGGDAVALLGELGSGKTVFVRGLAAGLGCRPEEVHSPSFTLVNEYRCGRSRLRLAHVDLYRIASAEELPGIGWDEYLRPGYVLAVEWPERAERWLPADHVRVSLESRGGDSRQVAGEATGPRAGALLRAWREALGGGEGRRAAGVDPRTPIRDR